MVRDYSGLTQWSIDAIATAGVEVQTRLRGNHLHILCEGQPSPRETVVVSQFKMALDRTPLESLLPRDAPKIYKIFVSGRETGAKRPEWTVKLDYPTSATVHALHPRSTGDQGQGVGLRKWLGDIADRTFIGDRPSSSTTTVSDQPRVIITPVNDTEAENQQPPTDLATPPDSPVEPALVATPENLARRGNPDAIASILSEIMGGLGVSVKVSIRNQKSDKSTLWRSKRRRLWVLCESAYSPDPSLLAEPIASRLRELQLQEFRDACILLRVEGETKADWMLRIDLTPPDRILKDWARWGDSEAIAILLNQKLAALDIGLRATLKESTLHLFCHQLGDTKNHRRRLSPQKETVVTACREILNAIGPQGIRAATIYGVEISPTGKEAQKPTWIDWLNLPAFEHPDLQTPTQTLAAQGDIDAIKFQIERLINPDLETKLATGGIKVLALRKGKFIHVMTEAPTCPSQSRVALVIARFLQAQGIEGVEGVRIYGRRAGQKHPLWRYGISLKPTEIDQPLTASEDFIDSELTATAVGEQVGQLVFSPAINVDGADSDLPSSQVLSALHHLSETISQVLMASQLFTSKNCPDIVVEKTSQRYQKRALAVACGLLGLLMVWQSDRLVGSLLDSIAMTAISADISEAETEGEQVPTLTQDPPTGWLSSLQVLAVSEGDGVFNHSGFTSRPGKSAIAAACDIDDTQCRLSQFVYPTFRSQQLDEQIVRYQQYIATHKRPPDILIIGSSRALRGIDPEVLSRGLVAEGHPPLRVFNFGINGATVQIVDLIIRRILPPEQLPQLIILADGVRALNSGREDRTYQAISASEAYQQISQGTFQIVPPDSFEPPPNLQETLIALTENALDGRWDQQQFQQAIQEQISQVSQAYRQRDRFKAVLQSIANGRAFATPPTPSEQQELAEAETEEEARFLPNGFLPLSVRFDPEIYYQNHAKVSGYYDSDYQNFQLDGIQTQSLKNIIAYTQSFRIPVVFVNMPLTDHYFDPVRSAYEEKFREHMERVAAETGLVFLDLGWRWSDSYDYFSDPSHLNRYGAIAVAEYLATQKVIPWPDNDIITNPKL
ncbi:MAG: hypothetical protein P5681_06575 [Limnospira sp. PMC 894.15]|uniref:DUF1574 domain-containing protein n=1 Tax=Limnospira fusiformis PMC 851.14 TaxID=2219512 RepID=A0ABU9EQ97_LIMFS|nr:MULTISPECIES: hypothetical protein [unclassified Limnospira]MDT9187467.1 hypothetical protein [Limnospira sp. PMC 894.15]MDT9274026.1 hypothetical protein [Limnospira sp. PMC 737.11]